MACRSIVDRRALLQGMAVAAAGVVTAGPAFAQATTAEEMPPQVGDLLASDRGSTALTPDDVRLDGGPFLAWAMSPEGVVRRANFQNALMLFRYDAATLATDVADKAGGGVLGYSVICTHAGCEVSDYLSDEKILACPCHGSRFDPKNNASVVMGPATRKLPQLALGLTADGKLSVLSVFDSRVGGDDLGAEDR